VEKTPCLLEMSDFQFGVDYSSSAV